MPCQLPSQQPAKQARSEITAKAERELLTLGLKLNTCDKIAYTNELLNV